jgi:predicted TIM-barrel fold metal-dependent hydrolase
MGGLNLSDPPAALEEPEGCHALGTRGVTVIAFRDGVEPQAPRYSEVFAAAERPGIPVWIHTGHHLCTRRPNELPHPRAIDVIAGRHLDLRTVAGHEVADLGLGDAVTHDWLRGNAARLLGLDDNEPHASGAAS